MKPYEKYKDSGVEWAGHIPNSWSLTKIKFATNNEDGKRVPISGEFRADIKGEYPYYGATGIVDYINDFIFDGSYLLIGEDGAPFFDPSRSVAFIANGKFWVNNHAHILKPKEFIGLNFLCYMLNCVDYREYITGSTRDKLTKGELSNIRVLLPTLQEQNAIANYLDHQTAIIDELIEKKTKQIALLKEKRQAIINETVTKGLDPTVKMKDSGVEWLGEIPENWEVVPIKHLCKIKYGLGQPPKLKEGGLPLIRATNIERGKIVTKDLIFVDPEHVPYERDPVLKENDIIVVRSGAYTADSAIIPKEFEGTITGYDMVIRPIKVNPKLLSFALLSNYLLYNQLFLKRSRAAQPHLNADELGESFVLVPSKNEQEIIVEFLIKKTEDIDKLIGQFFLSIEKLKEYRQSLISEAVTGKIDVREWQKN